MDTNPRPIQGDALTYRYIMSDAYWQDTDQWLDYVARLRPQIEAETPHLLEMSDESQRQRIILGGPNCELWLAQTVFDTGINSSRENAVNWLISELAIFRPTQTMGQLQLPSSSEDPEFSEWVLQGWSSVPPGYYSPHFCFLMNAWFAQKGTFLNLAIYSKAEQKIIQNRKRRDLANDMRCGLAACIEIHELTPWRIQIVAQSTAGLDVLQNFLVDLQVKIQQVFQETSPSQSEVPTGLPRPRTPASPSGRPRHSDDEWARREFHVNKRDKMDIYGEWVSRPGVKNRDLQNPLDTFQKVLRKPPKD